MYSIVHLLVLCSLVLASEIFFNVLYLYLLAEGARWCIG